MRARGKHTEDRLQKRIMQMKPRGDEGARERRKTLGGSTPPFGTI